MMGFLGDIKHVSRVFEEDDKKAWPDLVTVLLSKEYDVQDNFMGIELIIGYYKKQIPISIKT